MGFSVRAILDPRGTHGIDVVTDRAGRRALWIELCIVGVLSFGFSAIYAILSLIESELAQGLGNTTVALNPSRSDRRNPAGDERTAPVRRRRPRRLSALA